MTAKPHNKYATDGLTEAEYEPGGKVLRNRLGLRTKREVEKAETEHFERVQKHYWNIFSEDPPPTLSETLIKEMHRMWLGDIYDWAGKYRRVSISKEDCIFAFPQFVPNEMRIFEAEFLIPLQKGVDLHRLSEAIAEVHGRFEIIHPFREGNGRVGRMIADLMALQAGYPPLYYGRLKRSYIDAMKIFCAKNDLGPLKNIFEKAILSGIKKAKDSA